MTRMILSLVAAELVVLSSSACFAAVVETQIHSFVRADGLNPQSALVPDGKGGFYGTATAGGQTNRGTVFHLVPPNTMHPTWTTTTIHSFGLLEGRLPGDLTVAPDGSLYGNAFYGGFSPCNQGCGTLFRLQPPAQGQTEWSFSVIFVFKNKAGAWGRAPGGPLLLGSDGSLYGGTYGGGTSDNGVLYRLAPPSTGSSVWTQTVLHTFDGVQGASAFHGLVGDPKTVIYGSAVYGGAYCGKYAGGCGSVFQVMPPTGNNGSWAFQQIYEFKNYIDGSNPISVRLGKDAALYGVTFTGGSHKLRAGQVFKLTPPTGKVGEWTKTELHAFSNHAEGFFPESGVTLEPSGELYGNTSGGGLYPPLGCVGGCGTVFKLTPPAGGLTDWQFATVYKFQRSPDAARPINNPPTLVGTSLFGLTSDGGNECTFEFHQYQCPGAAYKIEW